MHQDINVRGIAASSRTPDPILKCVGIERRFGGVIAVSGVDLEIGRGEIFGLVGPNGSGKTTLTNAITGFYPPTKGTISLNGKPIAGMAPHEVAKLGVARTFQNLALFNGLSVLENILLGRHIHLKSGVLRTALYWWLARPGEVANRELAEEVIEFLQLESIRHEAVDRIPIGLKKRVELARALVAQPDLLILDEPSTGLAPKIVKSLTGVIARIRAEGVSVLLVEQNAQLASEATDRAYVMKLGRVVDAIAPDRWRGIMADDGLKRAYLGA